MTFMRNKNKPIKNKGRNKPHNATNARGNDGRGSKLDHKQRERSDRSGMPKVKASLFGMHAVTEAWLNPNRNVNGLFITESTLVDFEEILVQAKKAGLKRPEPEIIEKSALDKTLPSGTVHQGIAINCQNLEEIDLRDVIIKGERQERSVLMIFDQVTDPHNVGAIIRSACVFSADALILQKKHAPELGGVLAKTACGGVEHLDVVYETNLSRTIEGLQKEGYYIVGLDERGERTIGELGRIDKIALVMGAEGPGLRRLVRENCDELVKLPTGDKLSSLNVSNAAAVALYAITQA